VEIDGGSYIRIYLKKNHILKGEGPSLVIMIFVCTDIIVIGWLVAYFHFHSDHDYAPGTVLNPVAPLSTSSKAFFEASSCI